MRVHATRRLLHMGLLMAFVGFWAIAMKTWLPAAALIPIVGLALLALIEILLPLPLAGERTIEGGERLLLGDEATVEVLVQPAPLPFNLHLRDAVPEGFSAKVDSHAPFQMTNRGSAAVTSYKIRARRRGIWDFGQPILFRSSVMGLLERSAEFPILSQVTVLPASAKSLGVQVRPRPPSRQGATTRSLRRGPGDEFFALRQYLPGDSIGDVNWKASARMQRIITNEFLPDEPPRYLVYVDTRAASAEVGELDVFERTLELSSILVEALIRARAHVGLVLLSFHSLFLVPASGQNQLNRLRQMLIDARPGYEASLHELLLAGAPHLPGTADAILVTPNIYDATLNQALVFLRSRHRRVSLLTPAFPEPKGKDLESIAQRSAGTLLNAEQLAALEGLRGYADHAVQWPPEEPIAVTLNQLGMGGRHR